METIHIDSIIINDEDRIRKNFDDAKIADLAESIGKKGLYHAPVLQDDHATLVMGENRIKAIRQIYEWGSTFYYNGQEVPFNQIPYTTLSEMPEDSILEAELEENILRQDLSWQERAEATKRLHSLRQEQFGSDWSAKQTADEIHGEESNQYRRQRVREDIQLADHLDDPDVAAAKDEKEARKVVEKKAKEKVRQEKAEEVKKVESRHSLIHGDSTEILASWPPQSVDVIIADPPYGIDIHNKKQRDGEYHEYDDSRDSFEEAIQFLAHTGYSLAKESAHIYIFCDIRNWGDVAAELFLAGWEVWERPFIWYKGNTGSFGGADWGARRTYETVVYAAKNRRPVTALYHDVINVPKPTTMDHPAAKPADVYKNLLSRSVFPGDVVLDPFCGGGPIFPAADDLGAFATGIEMDDSYHAIAAETLKETENANSIADLAN